jgi:hypothetical protein
VPVNGAPADAQQLGSEMFELIDASPTTGPRTRESPQELRQLGVDSLTANTVRRLAVQGRTFTVTVVYRRPEGAWCRTAVRARSAGTGALNEGRFAVACDTPSGRRASRW